MKRIILLRFHKNIDLVQNRIDLLKLFNPHIPIYGLFGGEEAEFLSFQQGLKNLENILFLNIKDPDIKWRFSDYCVLDWYKNFGKKIDFEILHVVEYDLVLLDSLENLYPYKKGDNHIYITSKIELDRIKPEWNWYINPQFPTEECKAFERLMKEEYGIKKLYGSMAPGTTLTREYLEGYSKLNLPLIAFDEMRIPAIAQILKIPIKDNGFVKDWFQEDYGYDFRLFNTDNGEVNVEELLEAYKNTYKKAFHPVYKYLPIEGLLN